MGRDSTRASVAENSSTGPGNAIVCVPCVGKCNFRPARFEYLTPQMITLGSGCNRWMETPTRTTSTPTTLTWVQRIGFHVVQMCHERQDGGVTAGEATNCRVSKSPIFLLPLLITLQVSMTLKLNEFSHDIEEDGWKTVENEPYTVCMALYCNCMQSMHTVCGSHCCQCLTVFYVLYKLHN